MSSEPMNSGLRLVTSVMLGIVLVCAATLAGCKNVDTSAPRTTDASTGSHDQHFGSSHAAPEVDVSQVIRSGSGPRVGDTWTASVAVNVCGQFMNPLSGASTRGLSPQPDGKVVISPRSEEEAGHHMNLGVYADAVGLDLSTGKLTMPDTVTPPEIEVKDQKIPVAGQRFTTGEDCAGTRAKVAVWVYSPEAVRSGNGLVSVVEDPQKVPFIEDGMALVITFTPESSLPTLPPSAAVGG